MRAAFLPCLVFFAASCGEAEVRVGEAGHGADEHVQEALPEAAPGEPVELGHGLVREHVVVGRGPAAGRDAKVTLHYASYLASVWDEGDEPQPFDSSSSRHVPLALDLAARPKVVAGLARGVVGLRAGDEVVLRVPAALGWGEAGNPTAGVPADADLVYEVRVLEVE
jgi:FKBP-type peptidyl-prolyl cis-trans isomerase